MTHSCWPKFHRKQSWFSHLRSPYDSPRSGVPGRLEDREKPWPLLEPESSESCPSEPSVSKQGQSRLQGQPSARTAPTPNHCHKQDGSSCSLQSIISLVGDREI